MSDSKTTTDKPTQAEIEAAKSFLQTQQGNTSVYDHLTELVLHLITEQPKDALGRFEHISGLVKQGSFPQADPLARAGGVVEREELVEKAKAWATAGLSLFKADEEEEAGETVQDLTDDANYLEWAGVSIGRTEAFRVHQSLKRLASTSEATQLRFWGKILGKSADYYIAEGVAEAEDEEDDEATDNLGNTLEKTGEGANKYTYWVCNVIGEPWKRLPNVTPEQIIVAAKLRRFFVGDLEATVQGHPPFPGKENAYLRAVIARITAETSLCPTGIYKENEDEETFDVELADEEEEPFEPVDLTDSTNWVHYVPPINRIGRTQPNPPKLDDDGEEIEDPDAPEAGQLLQSALEDKLYGGGPGVSETEEEEEEEENELNEPGSAWAIRSCPSTGPPSGADETKVMVAVKSRRWPGAVTVGLGKRFVNCYVGYGVQIAKKPYMPTLPGVVSTEYDVNEEERELKEQSDVKEDPNEHKEQEEDSEEEED